MQLKEFDILLDIKKHNKIDYIEVVKGDVDTNIFNIQLMNGLEYYNLVGANVEVVFAKTDGTTVIQDEENGVGIIDNSKGKIQCVLKTNTIAARGKVVAEVRVKSDMGEMLLTTARFDFFVRGAIFDDDTIESSNEWPFLEQLLFASESEDTRNDNEAERITNEDERKCNEINRYSDEDERIVNESVRISNEETRIDNEEVRISNEETRVIQHNARKEEVETTISNANDKITDVENRFQQLTSSQQQDAEVVSARQSTSKGKTFASLDARLEEGESDLKSHKAKKASQNKLGHVKVDEKTIFINEEGEISVNNPYPHDLSGSAGSKFLISGTMEEGFFGEVSSSELITGDALASQVGISQGTSQHSTAGWLKFAYKGEIQFVAKKPIRRSISWDIINTAKCVYGDSGDKTVTINGLTYKVTLMRALEPSNDPKTTVNASSGTVNHHSEWNRLMCQIHEEAVNGSWGYPDNIESDIGILEHSLGSGSQGMYSDADLIVASGDGRLSLCQEVSVSTSVRLDRGRSGVSYSGNTTSSTTSSSYGWRPRLVLVP